MTAPSLAIDDSLRQVASQQPYPLLFATLSGAHLYGFPSADSDYDLRGVHILPLTDVIGLHAVPETIEVSEHRSGLDLDLVTHDMKKFFNLLLKRNGYVLEQLYSPLDIHTTAAHAELKHIAIACVTRHHSKHYLGFANKQWQLFSQEKPRRVKPLLYVYRVLLTGIHLMQTGAIEANLRVLNDAFQLPFIPELIDRKVEGAEAALFDDADLSFHQSQVESLGDRLKQASE